MTAPILDLYGSPPPTLHRPKLAAIACLFFAISGIVQMLTAALPFVIPPVDFESWINFTKIQTATVCASASVNIIAAIVLYVADLARNASPPISPWPRRLIPLFILFYAIGHCTAEFGFLSFLYANPSGITTSMYDQILANFYYPLFIAALAAAVVSYTIGFIYTLQVASFLRDKTFRVAAICILCPVLFVIASQLFLTANRLANLYKTGFQLPDYPVVQIVWGVISALVAISLTIFFFLIAHRLRRHNAGADGV